MTELVRVARGIWRPAEQVSTLAGRIAALLEACPEGTVVAGVTAARLHGLWLPARRDELIEVIVHPQQPDLTARTYNRRPGLRARRQTLPPDEVTVVDGIPVTTEARTWFDLAALLAPPDLIAAGDSALRGDATIQEMELILTRSRHRRGVVRARGSLPLLDKRSRSRPESHLRFALISNRLPAPEVNEPIFDEHGQWLAEPDLSYEDVRLALEYNGAEHADVLRMHRDISREIDVEWRGGWRLVVVGPAQVFGRPDQIASYVRHLRRERGPVTR